MKSIGCFFAVTGLLVVTGCGSPGKRGLPASQSQKAPPPPAAIVDTVPRLSVGTDTVGVITTVNAPGHFVVLNFQIGTMPRKGAVLGIYRQGVKIGEVQITGPQRDTLTAADILKGDCQVGDEARVR